MATRRIFKLTIFQLAIANCHAASGVIWRKQEQEFVGLFSIPQFAALQKENLANHRAIETQNFNKDVIKAVYYEEKNMVMFYDNDTRVTGICGELWYLLADYLNFTFVPLKATVRDFGDQRRNSSYTGLFGVLARNEAQIILRSATFSSGLQFADYTMPIWKSHSSIYVQPEWLYDNSWVFTLFSSKMWYSIVFLSIILSLVGYFLQKVPADRKFGHKKKDSTDFSLGDHVFYSYTMMCARGCIPDAFQNKFKLLSLSKSVFALLIILAYSSHLIYRMTNKTTKLPFKDLETFFSNTNYDLLILRGSPIYKIHLINQENAKSDVDRNNILRTRVHFIDFPQEMYRKMCYGQEKYAMLEIEDLYRAISLYNCQLHAIGKFNDTWITFAIRKNFRYKRSIDAALIKLSEVGLLDALKHRWLNIRLKNTSMNVFQIVDLQQVYLIFSILCCGAVISFVIFVLEYIVYYYETKGSQR